MRAFAIAFLLLLAPVARADDLATPSGEPWWKRLAECGGVTLALRDEAVEAKKPSADLAVYTVRMNGFLDAAWRRLARDRGIEESPAKRSVHRAAGARWQGIKDGGAEAVATLPTLESACAEDLKAYEAAHP